MTTDVATVSLAESDYLLPPDAQLIPVSELAPQARVKLGPSASEQIVLTRPGFRVSNRLLSPALADLVREFTTPSRLADAVLRFASAAGRDPVATLEDSFDALATLVESGMLVLPGSAEAAALPMSQKFGDTFADFIIERAIHALVDVEVYRARDASSREVALKVAREGTPLQFSVEAAALTRVDGGIAPALLAQGMVDGRAYLASEWRDGWPISVVAQRARTAGDRKLLHRLVTSLADGFSAVHRAGVLHGDIHTGNVLADDRAAVTILDFGRSTIVGAAMMSAPRAGLPQFYEPELAQAMLEGALPIDPTPAGEQFSLATIIYLLLTGCSPFAPAAERDEVLRRIATRPPLPFVAQGVAAWPAIEQVLDRALAKQPERRFADLGAFAEALRAASPPRVARSNASRTSAVVGGALADAREGWASAGGSREPTEQAWFCLRGALLRSDPDLLGAAEVWASRAPDTPGGAIVRAAVARAGSDRSREGAACASFPGAVSAAEIPAALVEAARLLAGAGARDVPVDPLSGWARERLDQLWDVGEPDCATIHATLALVDADVVAPPPDLREALVGLPAAAGNVWVWALASRLFPLDGFARRAEAVVSRDPFTSLKVYQITGDPKWLRRAKADAMVRLRRSDPMSALVLLEIEQPELAEAPPFHSTAEYRHQV